MRRATPPPRKKSIIAASQPVADEAITDRRGERGKRSDQQENIEHVWIILIVARQSRRMEIGKREGGTPLGIKKLYRKSQGLLREGGMLVKQRRSERAGCLRFVLTAGVLLLATAAAGCASIAQGDQQEVEIRTTPPDARCDIARGGAALGSVTTPGSLRLPRSGDAIDVACAKAGYEDAHVAVESGTNAAFWYNFYWLYPIITAPVTLIGLAVDWSTGDYHAYDSPIDLTLTASPAPPPADTTPAAGPQEATG